MALIQGKQLATGAAGIKASNVDTTQIPTLSGSNVFVGDVQVITPTIGGQGTNKFYVDSILVGNAAVPTTLNKEMNARVTTSDGQLATNIPILGTPSAHGYVIITVNGIETLAANGEAQRTTYPCYFSGDGGATARASNAIVAGDFLYWNGSIAGLQLQVLDRINFNYDLVVNGSTNVIPPGDTLLSQLTDVSVSDGPLNGDVLEFIASTAKWTSGPGPANTSTTLSGLTDVSVSSPTDGDHLTFNGTQWVPGTATPATESLPTFVVTNGPIMGTPMKTLSGVSGSPLTINILALESLSAPPAAIANVEAFVIAYKPDFTATTDITLSTGQILTTDVTGYTSEHYSSDSNGNANFTITKSAPGTIKLRVMAVPTPGLPASKAASQQVAAVLTIIFS